MNDLQLNVDRLNAQMKMAEIMARSRLVPRALQNNPCDVLIVLQYGFELDIPPMQAISGINVINGSPTVAPRLMLALIYRKIPNAIIRIDADSKENIVKVAMARSKDHEIHEVEWCMNRAKEMGLAHKDNWQKQPLTMLKWRAVSDCARVVFPDIIHGLYTIEEFDGDNDTTYYDDNGGIVVNEIKKANQSQAPSIGPGEAPVPQEKTILQEIIEIIQGLPAEDKEFVKEKWELKSSGDLKAKSETELKEIYTWLRGTHDGTKQD